MKKQLFISMLAMLAVVATSCKDANEPDNTAVGQVTTQINFAGTAAPTKASTLIPVTAWANIKQLQIFFVKADGTVAFSDIVTPTTGTYTKAWTNVPVGTYTVKLLANASAATDAITTSIGGTAATFDAYNVRMKNDATLVMNHKATTKPTWFTGTNNFFLPISEIFTATSAGTITVSATTPNTQLTGAGALKLKRDVSLMRVRVNPQPSGTTNDALVDYTIAADATIFIHRIPTSRNLKVGNVYGASVVSDVVLGAASGAWGTTTGIVDGSFIYGKDITVMATSATESPVVAQDYQYFVVISAQGKVGHKLADGITMATAGKVFWSGLVKANFLPNVIREVNFSLMSGGTTTVPTTPTEDGAVTIDVSQPLDWDSNIQVTPIDA